MPILLPKKDQVAEPRALNDEHHSRMVADPEIPEFTEETALEPGSNSFGTGRLTTASKAYEHPSNLCSTGGAMQESGDTLLQPNKSFSAFVNNKWRPLMGWCYMLTCVTDFVVFPILWSVLQAASHGQVTNQWIPLTLQGAGLYHIAMGTVLGITAYGRTREKIAERA